MASSPDPDLSGCDGLEPEFAAAAPRPLSESGGLRLIVLEKGKGRRVVALDERPEAAAACTVWDARARETQRLRGHFSDSRVAVLAAMQGCGDERCELLAILEDASGKVVSARPLDLSCTNGFKAQRLTLSSTWDVVRLDCRSGAGAGYSEGVTLLDLRADPYRNLLSADLGSVQSPTLDERKAPDFCAPRIAGSLRVITEGAAPEVETFEPKGFDEDGVARGERSRWRLGQGGAFERVASPERVPYEPCANPRKR